MFKGPDFFPDPIMAEPKVVEDAIPVNIDSEMQNDSTEDIIENIKVTYEEIPSDAAPDKTIPILVGVGVGLLTLLLIFLFTRRKSLGRGKIVFLVVDINLLTYIYINTFTVQIQTR